MHHLIVLLCLENQDYIVAFVFSAKKGDYFLQTNGQQPFSKGLAGISFEKLEEEKKP